MLEQIQARAWGWISSARAHIISETSPFAPKEMVDDFIADLALHRCRRLVEQLAHDIISPHWNPANARKTHRRVMQFVRTRLSEPTPVYCRELATKLSPETCELLDALATPAEIAADRIQIICEDLAKIAFFSADEEEGLLRFTEEPIAEYLVGAEVAEKLAHGDVEAGAIGAYRHFRSDDFLVRTACLELLKRLGFGLVPKEAATHIEDALKNGEFIGAERLNAEILRDNIRRDSNK